MIRILTIILILFPVLLSIQVSAGGNRSLTRYLKESAVKWEGNVITGELRGVPIKGLLEELLQGDGFDWEVIGELNGTISVSFDHLTIEESIRKIMRINRFNYVLIVDGLEPYDSKSAYPTRELMIYQNDKIIRFSRTRKINQVGNDRETQKIAKKPAPNPMVTKKVHQKSVPSTSTKADRADFPTEIQEFVDELLTEKKISPEEYKKVMEDMGMHKN